MINRKSNERKVYCSISNHLLSSEISEDKLNYKTYVKLLEYYDEIHIYGRVFQSKSHIKKDQFKNIFIHYISVPKLSFFKYIFSIIKMFYTVIVDNKKYNFSIFDASEPTTGGIVCVCLTLFLKKPYILQIQGELTRLSVNNEVSLKTLLSKYITLFCIKYSSKVRAVSTIIKKQLIEDGVIASKIEVIPARVDLKQFNYKKYLNVDLKKDYNIQIDKKVFVFVGRLVEGKGVKYMIEAFTHIEKYKFHLLIIGDGIVKNKLVNLTKTLNLKNNITFVGKVEFDRVPYFMYGADFFIFPTLHEGFGRVVLESIAMRTLVLASRVGGIQDIIIDKVNNDLKILFPKGRNLPM